MKSFRELRVWQAGMGLVEKVYRLTQHSPKEEKYALRNSLTRSLMSRPTPVT